MTHKRKTTMQNIAQAAKVSIATVSRVYKNDPKVRASTRKKVLDVAKKFAYTPNVSARSLASSKSFSIGLLHDYSGSLYFSEILLGTMNQCRQSGYKLVLIYCGHDLNNFHRPAINDIKDANLDGAVILERITQFEPIIKLLYKTKLKHVCISSEPATTYSPYICIDNHSAAFEATEYLIGLGHKKIGFIRGHVDENISHLRFNGYRNALNKHNIPLDKKLVQQGDFSLKSGEYAASILLKLPNRPTAIFASNDAMATGVLTVAYKMHIRVPDELSVTGFDDTPIASLAWPKLTSVRQNIREQSELAVGLLVDIIAEDVLPKSSIFKIVPHSLEIRGSTSKPKS